MCPRIFAGFPWEVRRGLNLLPTPRRVLLPSCLLTYFTAAGENPAGRNRDVTAIPVSRSGVAHVHTPRDMSGQFWLPFVICAMEFRNLLNSTWQISTTAEFCSQIPIGRFKFRRARSQNMRGRIQR